MRRPILRLLHPVLRRAYAWWSRKPRRFRRDGLDLAVLPGVFHPGLFFSTGTLARHVASLDLQGRTFLELGAGTGRIALIAARMGAYVTASDINPASLANVELNRERNHLPVLVVRSDLFDHLPQHFDVVAINPPYYARDPRNDAERAFFSGATHDYFVRLFPVLAERIARGTRAFMVLSEDADRSPIERIARTSRLMLSPVFAQRAWGETQTVFAIVSDGGSTAERA